MNRIETTFAIAVLAGLAAVHGPAFGQDVRIEDEFGGAKIEVKPDRSARSDRRTPPRPPKPPKPVEPSLWATGGYESSEVKARESAIRAAVDKLHEYMLTQNPPVTRMPTTKFVQKLLLDEHQKVTQTEDPILTGTGTSEKMYKVTVALRVEPSHVRELRSQERSAEALWVLAGLGGLAAVAAGFFRVDAWTKGYLTNWLVLGTVGVAALFAGLWWWAK